MNTESNSKAILIFILTFGVFSILSTELGAMGLIPILQIHFGISAADAGWAVSIFALMITLCAPIVPLLCAGFNQKKAYVGLSSRLSYEAAQAFFALLTGITLVFTIFFVPNTGKGEKPYLKEQLSILKSPLLWLSIFAVIIIQAAIFGFYGYLSEFLHKVTQLNFTHISVILAIYGGTNIVGNILAGRALSTNANRSILLSAIFMSLLYVAIFVEAQNALVLAGIILVLGILAGIMNNVVHFMITDPFPKQAEFTNGIFLSVANIGLSLGAIICGYVSDMLDIKMSALSSCILVVLGVIVVCVRARVRA